MNTNEASLGRTTVQTYSSREKRAFDGVLFSMECTARWLENACDPMQAASEIRLAMAELRSCIADCEFIADAGSQSSLPNGAIGERVREAVIAERIYAQGERIEARYRAALSAEKVAAEPGAYADNRGSRSPGDVMMSAHALCPDSVSGQPARMRWIADYFLKNYAAQQPVQRQLALTDEQISTVRRLHMHLEAGRFANGVSHDRMATYTEALGALLRSTDAQ
jgi:hypothetical protein